MNLLIASSSNKHRRVISGALDGHDSYYKDSFRLDAPPYYAQVDSKLLTNKDKKY